MKKILANLCVVAVLGFTAACSTHGHSEPDETLTQAPYAEERTVGDGPVSRVRSAQPVFERRQRK